MGERMDIADRLRWYADGVFSCPDDVLVKAAAEIARLREERRWIPVGERLPSDEVWVDVAGRWGDFLGWHDGEEWRNVEEDPFPSEVTHWRKRPQGPEAPNG